MNFFERRQAMFQSIGASLFVGMALLIIFVIGLVIVIGLFSRCGRLAKKAKEEKKIYLKWSKKMNDRVYIEGIK